MLSNVRVYTFKHGGKLRRSRLSVEEIVIMDNNEREAYILGEEAIPLRSRSLFGFPVRSRMVMVLEGIADTIPHHVLADGKRAKRTTDKEAEQLEDLRIHREVQKAQGGTSEPIWARLTGIAIIALAITDIGIAGLWAARSFGG